MKKRKPSRTLWIIGVGLLAIAGLLTGSGISYWRYVNELPVFTPQHPPMPEPNGYTRAHLAASQLFANNRPPVYGKWLNGNPDQLREQVAPFRPALESVRDAFRLQWQAPPPPPAAGFMQPYISDSALFPKCARYFVAESRLARSQGDRGAAMQRSLDAMELGSHVARGGNFRWRQIGLECHALGLGEAQRLAYGLPASDILDTLERVRRVSATWPSVSESLESQRTFMMGSFVETCRQAYQFLQRLPKRDRYDAIRVSLIEYGPWKTADLLLTSRKATLANIDAYYRRQIAESRRPVRQRGPVRLPADPWLEQIPFIKPLDDPWQWERIKTDFALLEVALAVRAHYLEHGRYPARLDEISKRWLPQVPQDLWDQPVAYRLKRGKPEIYSLGPDGKDDGGQAADPVTLGPKTQGDLVFGQLTRRSRAIQ